MLLAEGFRDEGYVDIFDGGPTLVAPIDAVRTIATSREAAYLGDESGSTRALIATGFGSDFRLVRGCATAEEAGVRLDARSAQTLRLNKGDLIRFASIEGNA
jgi:arginine N-succinyltransferase